MSADAPISSDSSDSQELDVGRALGKNAARVSGPIATLVAGLPGAQRLDLSRSSVPI